ncbi:hypothetical protein [Streptomyces sp. NPDC048385]|uniref:hypothetical protein n=1 Tax=unclassified Streptomyces TaxID=2593676 RepID=UPI0034407188
MTGSVSCPASARAVVPSGTELAELQDSHRFLMNLRRTLDSFLASPSSARMSTLV